MYGNYAPADEAPPEESTASGSFNIQKLMQCSKHVGLFAQGRYVPPYVTSLYVSYLYDTSPYVISWHFYILERFITEVLGPYSGLG
jgi:hypothetical protein